MVYYRNIVIVVTTLITMNVLQFDTIEYQIIHSQNNNNQSLNYHDNITLVRTQSGNNIEIQ